MVTQYFVFANAAGQITGSGATQDGTIPAGAIQCTADQAANIGGYVVSAGAVVAVSAAQQLASAQTVQNAKLNSACANAIASGFSSSALGTAYSYPSTLTDQQNQQTIAQCSSGGSLWCATGGTWSLKAHTQVQAQAVIASFSMWLNKCQQQLVTLTGQVNAATNISAAQAVAWTNPV